MQLHDAQLPVFGIFKKQYNDSSGTDFDRLKIRRGWLKKNDFRTDDIQLNFQDHFDTLSQARRAVEKGHAWGVIHFNQNYSQALQDRIELASRASEETVTSADILVNLDMSSEFFVIFFFLGRRGFSSKIGGKLFAK